MVPIVGDALVAGSPRQRAVRCFGDCEEGLEGLFVEYAIRVLGRVI